MLAGRRRGYEEEIELSDVLQPYEQPKVYADEEWLEGELQEPVYDPMYMDPMDLEDYSEEHEAVDYDTRFHIAMGMFDLISILVGIAVILALVAMFAALFQWLQNDLMNSALLMQSGLK